jgi:hypothetical protein
MKLGGGMLALASPGMTIVTDDEGGVTTMLG